MVGEQAAKSEPKIDPYRTIEIAPIRSSEPTPQTPTNRPKLQTLRQTTTIQLGCGGPPSETTDFDVPVVKPTVEQPVIGGSSAATLGAEAALPRQDRRPMIVKAPAPAQDAPVGSDPWFQERGSDRPVSTSSAAKVGRRRPSLSVALEKLGLRAKRQPVLVFGGAAIGSLVLVLFFAGAAKVLSPHSGPKTERVMAARPTVTGTGTPSVSSKASTREPANETAAAPSAAVQTPIPAEAKPEDVPAAIAATPDVAPAVGHLFAGRLPEAEQAYRDLATKFPGEPAFQSASRILARKNGPNCRGANSSKTACPSVKP